MPIFHAMIHETLSLSVGQIKVPECKSEVAFGSRSSATMEETTLGLSTSSHINPNTFSETICEPTAEQARSNVRYRDTAYSIKLISLPRSTVCAPINFLGSLDNYNLKRKIKIGPALLQLNMISALDWI
ncbi:hypothetical protein WAI453_004746 [Rhynchosporium graminicola]